MFDGLNNNRSHWNELAQVYEAKIKAIEDEKKKLEEQENKKGPVQRDSQGPGWMWMKPIITVLCFFHAFNRRWREVQDLRHLLSDSTSGAEPLCSRLDLRRPH